MAPEGRLSDRLRSRWRDWSTPLPDDDAEARRERLRPRTVAIDVGIVVVLVTALLTWALKLWSVSPRVPFSYEGDTLFYGLNAKSIIETGWIQENARVGAPFGLEMYDFPLGGDNGNYLVMKAMSWFTGDWGLLLNAFYLLGFFTAAVVSYVCLRWLGAGRVASVVCAVVYAFAPFHFFRLGHMMLAHYAVLPLGVVLAVRAASGRAFRSEGSWRATSIAWVVVCVAVGSFGTYWAIFSVISIVIVAVMSSFVHRTTRPAVAGAVLSLVVTAVFVFNQLGTVLYHRTNGPNPAVGIRNPVETDVYGLRLAQLLTPVPGTRFRFLHGISATLMQGFNSENTMFLGVVAGGCFAALLAWLAVRAVRGARGATTDTVPALLAVLAVFWVLLATTGGLTWFAIAVGFDRLRGWNRASILIMFVVLAWGALWIAPRVGALLGRIPTGSRFGAIASRYGMLLLGALVLVIAVFDQTPRGAVVFDPRTQEARFASDRAFFTEIEAELHDGALVAQLPIRRFPETPPQHGSFDYDLLRPYLSTDDLRWTYGGMKFRESEWQQALVGLEGDELVRDLLAAGSAAVLIDRAGYDDGAASIERSLTRTLDRQPRVSPDERWSYYPLEVDDDFASEADLARRRQELLEEPILVLPDCVPFAEEGEDPVTWCDDGGGLNIVTPQPSDQAGEISFEVATNAGTGQLTLRGDGLTQVVPLGPEGTRVRWPIPAGEDYLWVEYEATAPPVAAGDNRRFFFTDVEP